MKLLTEEEVEQYKKSRVIILENVIKEAIILLGKEGINSKQKAKELLEKSLDEYYTYKR